MLSKSPSMAAASLRMCTRCLFSASKSAPSRHVSNHGARPLPHRIARPTRSSQPRRLFGNSPLLQASATSAKEAMETIEQLYENATEEFQIAAEETESNTVYASDDREAAKEEIEKLQAFYMSVVEGEGYEPSVREEVRRRAGQRIGELANAMTALEEKAMEHD